jgi:hypothetical protein
MTLSRFAILLALFVAMLALGAPASHAQVNYIGFCADDPSMGMFIGDGKSAMYCSSDAAYSEAKRNAISFADRFARQGCARFSQDRCTSICSQNGTTPLKGSDAQGATFTQERQRQKGWPADSVQWINRGGGFCARTWIVMADGGTPSGPNVCPNTGYSFFHPFQFFTQKTAGTARAFSWCGCACR